MRPDNAGKPFKKARQLARISSKPVFVFKELVGYLDKNRVILPAYSSMQDIISKALATERQRLGKLARKHINADIRKDLENLLARQDSLYFLTILKKDPKDFGHQIISQEIYKQRRIKPLYLFAAQFLPKLGEWVGMGVGPQEHPDIKDKTFKFCVK